MPLAAKFNGPRDADGQPLHYISGVPAGDIDADAWAAIPEERRLAAQQAVMADGKRLYTVYKGHRVADPATAETPDETPEEAPAEAPPAESGG